MFKKIKRKYISHRQFAEESTCVKKILYILLSVEIAAFAILYINLYPLEFSATGYLSQIPLCYWIMLLVLIATSGLLAFHADSPFGSFVSTLSFYGSLNSHQFLFYSHVGGDVPGEIRDITQMLNFYHFDPTLPPIFLALQWPNNYTFLFVLKRTLGVQSVISAMDIGYMSYYFGLTVAVWLFAYRLDGGFFAYLASISYLMVSWSWINNQFVPQFLALILLFFLFYVRTTSGRRWFVLELALFLSLAFSHPIFAVFYPLFVVLKPGIESCLSYYRAQFPDAQLYQILLRPIPLLRPILSIRTWFPDKFDTYYRALVFGTIYATVYLFQYVLFRRQFFVLLTAPVTEATGDPFSRIIQQFFAGSEGSVSEPQVALLYELVPQTVDFIVSWGHRLVVIAMVVVFIVSLLWSQIRVVKEYQGEIIVICALVLASGWAINSEYGLRVLQIAFLPASVFFYGLSERGKRVIIVCILLLSLVSPVVLANLYVDQTLTASGNTIGYSESQAGKTIENYNEGERVLVPPSTPFPTGGVNSQSGHDISRLVDDKMINYGPGLMIYSDRLSYFLKYHRYNCDRSYLSTDVIYDNDVQVYRATAQEKLLSCTRDIG
jgi:hypothetical protein